MKKIKTLTAIIDEKSTVTCLKVNKEKASGAEDSADAAWKEEGK